MSATKTKGSIAGRAASAANAAGHRREVAAAVALFALGPAAFVSFTSASAGGLKLLAASALFSLIFLPYPALSVKRWAAALSGWVASAPRPRAGLLLLLPLVAYAGYAGATATLNPLFILKYALYAGVPAWLMTAGNAAAARDPFGSPVRFLAAILILWLPMDFRWLTGFRLPAGPGASVNVVPLIALDVALLLFIVVAPVRDLGFTFRIDRADVRRAVVALAAFALVAIPVGLRIGFIRYGWRPFQPLEWGLVALNIYFLVAIPEEFLFRGLLQNLIEKRWPGARGRPASLLLGAIVFGAAHLNNGRAPNFRYMLLATIAGLAYGWVWMRTRKVTASAITHAAVDWIWVMAFRA